MTASRSRESSNYRLTISIRVLLLTYPDLSGCPPRATKASTALLYTYSTRSLQEFIPDSFPLSLFWGMRQYLKVTRSSELVFLCGWSRRWFYPCDRQRWGYRCLDRVLRTADDIDEIVETDASIALFGAFVGSLEFCVLCLGEDAPLLVEQFLKVEAWLPVSSRLVDYHHLQSYIFQ